MPAPTRRTLPAIDVAVTILRDASGRVLLAERLPRQLSAGYWELPGGKVDSGETPIQAAAREAHEEVGVIAEALRPFVSYEHIFPLRRLRLSFFLATRWSGSPHGREGQRIAWVDPARIGVAPVLPSNQRVLALLALPGRGFAQPSDRMADAMSVSASAFVILRTRRETRAMAQHALRPVLAARARTGGMVFVEDDLQLTALSGVDGVFTTTPPYRWTARPDVPLWAVRCQGVQAIEAFARLGADVAVLPFESSTDADVSAATRAFAAVYLEVIATEAQAAERRAAQAGARGIIIREACRCACAAKAA